MLFCAPLLFSMIDDSVSDQVGFDEDDPVQESKSENISPTEEELLAIDAEMERELQSLDQHSLSREAGSFDVFTEYLNRIGKTPLLDRKAERALAERMKRGDKGARELFIRSNLRLVVHIARGYRGSGREIADLVQWGNEGIIKAADKFEPSMGYKFSTYAIWWIRQSIQRALNDLAPLIRIPVHSADLYRKIVRIESQRRLENGSVSDEEVAAILTVTVKRVMEAKERHRLLHVTSFSTPIGSDGESAFEDLLSRDELSTEIVLSHAMSSRGIRNFVEKHLDERESQIIILRFGLDGNEGMTLEEVGNLFGLTRERIRQIEGKALIKIEKRLGGRDPRI